MFENIDERKGGEWRKKIEEERLEIDYEEIKI